ncbi:MAG: pyrroline-5-carboxylate reductase family protein [Bacillota bacterium]
MKNTIAIIGCGRMGSFLAGKLSDPYQVYVYDQNPRYAENLAETCGVKAVAKEELNMAEVVILALATDILPNALLELEKLLKNDAVIVNIATTLGHDQLQTGLNKVSAKIIGHYKEMSAGEKPVIIIEGTDQAGVNLVADVFSHIGTVVKGQSDMVTKINTISSQFGIVAALEIKKVLGEMQLSEEIIIAAIRNVAAGTMKAFAVGDVGPFAQKIAEEFEKENNTK